MADYSVTLNNSLNLFGVAPTSLWNAYNWGSFLWGEGTQDLETRTVKVLDSSVSLDSAVTLSAYFVISVANDLSTSADMGSESLSDGSGYNYVVPSNVTEFENRSIASYTAGSAASTSWTTATATSVVWS
jgi:hypothetical protein